MALSSRELGLRCFSKTCLSSNTFLLTSLEILICALLIQILCNYVNDLHDFYKGSDSLMRIGPIRIVQSGLLSPELMQKVILTLTLIIILIGMDLSAKGGSIILAIGLISILGAYIYTAGPYPLAHNGLGEIFVLIFFGPVPVYGTYLLLTGQNLAMPALFGIPLGLIAAAILIVNNLRDLSEDSINNKNTLAVRYGKKFSVLLFALMLILPYLIVVYLGSVYLDNLYYLYILVLIPLSLKLINQLRSCVNGHDFNTLLAKVGGFLFIFSLILATLVWL